MFPHPSQIVLGTAQLGVTGDRTDAYRLLDCFLDRGGRIIDTAAIYSDWVPGEIGRSEAIIGEWLGRRGDAQGLTIVTKGAHPPLADMAVSRLDPASLRTDVELSLQRLGLETLPLYFLHRDDTSLPVAAILEPLARLVEEGKIERLGVSNWTNARLRAAIDTGILPIASNQVYGNILVDKIGALGDPSLVCLDAEVMAIAEAADQSVMLFSSQCEGFFSRRHERPEQVKSHYRNAQCERAGDAIERLAREQGFEPAALAVSFLLSVSERVFPIVGPRTVAQVEKAMATFERRLDAATVEELTAISGFSRILPA